MKEWKKEYKKNKGKTWPEDRDPYFACTETCLKPFLEENLVYPHEAYQKGIKGTVEVAFNVEPNGKIKNVHVISDPLGSGCEEAAIRFIKLTNGKWIPGIVDGKVKSMEVVFPIKFGAK